MRSPRTMFLTAPQGMKSVRSSSKAPRSSACCRNRSFPQIYATHHLPTGAWLAPGFIDLQVNGGGDVLFNNSPTPETIITIAGAHRKFGTTSLLPTFITDTREKMQAAMAAVLEALDREPSVLGIHLEGPFLSPEKAGVHDPGLMRAPDEADIEMLCSE